MHKTAEYGTAGAASKEGDTYSYGILVLEMFSGKRPTNEMFKDGLYLHDFVNSALPTRLLQVTDPILEIGANMHKCLLSILEIASNVQKNHQKIE